MAIEIPGVVPSGLRPEYKHVEKAPIKSEPVETGKPTRKTDLPLDEDLNETMRNLENVISQFNRRFKISLDESINRIVIKVIDADTDKVIREIPPREIQHLLANLKEMMGLLVNETI